MRRSDAPSRTGRDTSSVHPNRPSISNVRSVCKEVNDNKTSTHTQAFDLNDVQSDANLGIKSQCFEAVYGKASTKKHKTWEGDGYVIVTGRSVKLLNENKKAIGSCSGHKLAFLEALEEGSLISIGGYQAELISRIQEPGIKHAVETKTDSFEIKTNIPAPPVVCTMKLAKPPTTNISNLSNSPEVLLMPKPPSHCIWSQNPEGLRITDVVLEAKLARRLQDHQREGIVFLYKCLMGFQPHSFARTRDIDNSPDGSSHGGPIFGCILADEMGLGKTIQAIASIWILLRQGPYGGKPVIRKCLVVTPGTLVQNWVKEFSKWLGRERLPVYAVDQAHPLKSYLHQPIRESVLIMSYEMFLQHSDEVCKIPDLDMIVCDEGHRLKNTGINTTVALSRLPARRRLLLTGTPLQNHLDELWSLAEFCAPGYLAQNLEEFRRQFVLPFSSNSKKHVNSEDDEQDVEISPSEKLGRLINSFLLRRTSELLASRLSSKTEHIVFCRPSPLQSKLESILSRWVCREFELDNLSSSPSTVKENKSIASKEDDNEEEEEEDWDSSSTSSSSSRSSHSKKTGRGLSAVTAFRKLHNHPYLLRRFLNPDLKKPNQNVSGSSKDLSRLPSKITRKLQSVFSNSNSDLLEKLSQLDLDCQLSPTELDFLISLSGKLEVLCAFVQRIFPTQMSSASPPSVKRCKPSNGATYSKNRLVLVSNFTQTLDLLEIVCKHFVGSCYSRLDGQTSTKKRGDIVQRFNDPNSKDYILLLSSHAGGTGLNLTGANYLILFDMDWNPANDAQAMARIWRPGQSRPVHLYRLVTAGGIEERIFQRQAAKLALTSQALLDPATSLITEQLWKRTKQTKSGGILTREELKYLFDIPSIPYSSWTHVLLNCPCHSSTESPSPSLSSDTKSEKQADSDRSDVDEDDESDIRYYQLGLHTNMARSFQSPATRKRRAKQSKSSSSLGFLLDWKHSLNLDDISGLGDPLLEPNYDNLLTGQSSVLPICSVFTLHTQSEKLETVQTR